MTARKHRILRNLEKMNLKNQKREQALQGEGRYIFKNNTSGTLTLPKPASKILDKDGNSVTRRDMSFILHNEKFEGDSYFMSMVKSHDLIYVEKCVTEEEMPDKKLILDQPDQITEHGKVEHVIPDQPVENLTEDQKEEKEVLLTEDPMDGIEIILE